MLCYIIFGGKKGKGGEKKENKKHLLQGESKKNGKQGKRMKRKEKQITKQGESKIGTNKSNKSTIENLTHMKWIDGLILV